MSANPTVLPAVLGRYGVSPAPLFDAVRVLRLARALSGWEGASLCVPGTSGAPCGSLAAGSPCAAARASGVPVLSGPAPGWVSVPLVNSWASLCLWTDEASALSPGILALLEDLVVSVDSELCAAERSAALERALVLESRTANVDVLTGLPNRRSLEDALLDALSGCDSAALVAVTFLDLDGFKPVNDTLGHAAGDELLRLVSARLAKVLRPGDLLGRFGGDEFVAICPGMTEGALPSLVERFRSVFATPFVVDGREILLGTSVGVTLGSASSDPFELLRQADAAMYSDKRARRSS